MKTFTRVLAWSALAVSCTWLAPAISCADETLKLGGEFSAFDSGTVKDGTTHFHLGGQGTGASNRSFLGGK